MNGWMDEWMEMKRCGGGESVTRGITTKNITIIASMNDIDIKAKSIAALSPGSMSLNHP